MPGARKPRTQGRAAPYARNAKRTGAIGGSRQPRRLKAPVLAVGGVEVELDEKQFTGDGMGYLPRPEGWEPLPPNGDPGAAKAYFPCVQNIVSTCDVMQPINPFLAAYVCHGRCDSTVFPAATVPILWPHGTISAFGTGRLVVSGVWEMLQGIAATQLFLCKLSEVTKIPYRIYNFHVENVVGSAAIGRRVRLRELAAAHADDVLYTPETFAGLSYRPRERPECNVFRNGRPVVGVFPSGCMVFCGAYDLTHLVDTFLYMHEFLKPFLIH